MEEIREVALAYYANCTPELRGKTWEFFQSMDTSGDHRISPREFNEFLQQTGYNTIITDPEFFAKLDRNGDRGLDFEEAMGNLYREAIACYYNPSSQEFRSLAVSFFHSLATQTHGANYQISSTVFNNFLEEGRYKLIINDPYLFQKLDRNGDGSLDFWETLTFYHIISTRYFHCRSCKVYLSGLYFTCVVCFEASGAYNRHHHHYDPGTYDLCAACYRSRNYHHPDHTYFLDNHILLRSKRGHTPYAPHLVTAPKPLVVHNNNNYYYNTYIYHPPAVQPVPPKENWLSKLNILEVALASANLALNCSIM
ncbi:hypothetical protein ACLB2K_038337 [Fragaria x ananassa]